MPSRRVAPMQGGLGLLRSKRYRRLRIASAVFAGTLGLVALAGGALWWRLATGPLSLDLLTPWLTAALEQRFGGRHRIQVGGTQIERDEEGRAAVRLRDITVRDAAGTIVASAPKAEVGIAGIDFSGDLRPERLNLLGAEMAVRIEPNGELRIFAGRGGSERDRADHPQAATPAVAGALPPEAGKPLPPVTTARADSAPDFLSTLVNWVQSLDAVGLDGRDLVEVGLKGGTITVDDRRADRTYSFENINLSLTRVKDGTAALSLSSRGSDGPWSVNATVTPGADGTRVVAAAVRDLSPKDVILALRLDTGDFQADAPLTGELRAEVGPDGTLKDAQGRIVVGAGYVGDAKDPMGRMLIDEAQIRLRWDAAARVLSVPIEVQAGASRIALTGRIEPPRAGGGSWAVAIAQGTLQLASRAERGEAPVVLDKINIRASYDPALRRARLEQGELRGPAATVTLSGVLDVSGPEPVLTFAANGSRMSAAAFKRLWPAFIVPDLRTWIETNVLGGQLERVAIALNAPTPTLKESGPPMPDGALSVDLVGRNVLIRPVPGLPPVRDADITAHITGKSASVAWGRGVVETSPGRKLIVSAGTFEVPSYSAEGTPARAKFRMEGGIDAATELLGAEPLRDAAPIPFDAASARGTLTAQVSLGLPLKGEGAGKNVRYGVEADLANFSAERFVRGLRADAGQFHVSASDRGLLIKGDLKLAGSPAALEYRKTRSDPDAEVRLQATLDDAARARFGLELGPALTGPIPIKLAGRMKPGEHESRLGVEADLTHAKVNEPFPGWTKAAGRSARASFTLLEKGGAMRLDDIVLEGAGTNLKGSAELGPDGDLLRASFPVFGLSDGDKASLRVDRGADGIMKIAVRGDLFDGRAFVKTAVSGRKPERSRSSAQDVDLEIKVGALTGHHGEALRSVDLRASRRGGKIRAFALSGWVGRDGKVTGDLRGKGSGRELINIEASDAGALLRFTDTYPRLVGGALSLSMDPPTADQRPQEGQLNVRDFTVRDEAQLNRVASSGSFGDGNERGGARSAGMGGVSFSRLKADFTRSPGRLAIHDGVVWGAALGATMDGVLDYLRDQVHLRGTFVPAYALNNIFSQIPIVGTLLGNGANEGLLGITYQVIGSPQAPVLQVNPMSAVAPGFLRKLFEFRGADEGGGGSFPRSPASAER